MFFNSPMTIVFPKEDITTEFIYVLLLAMAPGDICLRPSLFFFSLSKLTTGCRPDSFPMVCPDGFFVLLAMPSLA